MTIKEKMDSLLNELGNRLDQISENASKTVSESEEKLAKAKEKLSVATEKMNDARDGDNLKAYQDAYRAVQDLTAEIEFYTARIDANRNKPLLKQDEYNQILSDVQSTYYAYELENAEKILPLLREILRIATEEMRAWEKGNAIFASLDADIMKKKVGLYLSHEIKTSLPTLELARQLMPSNLNYLLAQWMQTYEEALKECDPDE